MKVEEFFENFLLELQENANLRSYYKFLNNKSSFGFRKAYFCQRLEFIINNIDKEKDKKIWDCGSGYGTTGIFLALNGIATHGSTLEFYYKEIPQRMKFWSKFGDVSKFTCSYENLFDTKPEPSSNDVIIVQDTLHHLEPLQQALEIFRVSLKPGGKLIAVEENGNNIIQNFKLYMQRGNKRIIEMYDEKLDKNILIGNENIRSFSEWEKELSKQQFRINQDKIKYIRFYPPFYYRNGNYDSLISREQALWNKNDFLKERFFFGLNFVAQKTA